MSGRDYSAAELEALFTGDVAALFGDALLRRKMDASRAYKRPGLPYLFTPEQWDDFDSWNALCDERERKYGRQFPQLAAQMRNLGRRIW